MKILLANKETNQNNKILIKFIIARNSNRNFTKEKINFRIVVKM
jgi:hypothetical protein